MSLNLTHLFARNEADSMVSLFQSTQVPKAVCRRRILTSNSSITVAGSIISHTPPRHNRFLNKWNTQRRFQSSSAPSSQKFTYGIGASFSAKNRTYDPKEHSFTFNYKHEVRSPLVKKRIKYPSGQDDFFVSRVGQSSNIALGVADGVGGWDRLGFNSGDVSNGICTHAAFEAFTHDAAKWGQSFGAHTLLQRAYKSLLDDDNVKAGSTTALVALARADGKLDVANLGDSGFVQFRLNAIHAYLSPQTHNFNTPYQLTLLPDRKNPLDPYGWGQCIFNYPDDADISQHQLQHGDVLVFATDGLWDNLFHTEILKIVSNTMICSRAWERSGKGVSVGQKLPSLIAPENNKSLSVGLPCLLAQNIVSIAKAQSFNTQRDNPFTRELAKCDPGFTHSGGKIDDICVLVAIVSESDE